MSGVIYAVQSGQLRQQRGGRGRQRTALSRRAARRVQSSSGPVITVTVVDPVPNSCPSI